MKALKILAMFAVLASSAFAQKPGFFVTAGGGVVRMETGNFSVYNPVASIPDSPLGEQLQATNTRDKVSMVRLTTGYNFTENWALQASYADYGTAEVEVAFPQYPGMVWTAFVGGGPDIYTRHVLKYKPTALTLMPTYTKAIGDTSRFIFGAGLCSSTTTSHFETTVIPGGVLSPTIQKTPVSTSYAEETDHHLGYIVQLGFDYVIIKNFSVQVSGNYSWLEASVPSSPWATRSKDVVRVDAYAAELALSWHW
jgi:outer membrane protein W